MKHILILEDDFSYRKMLVQKLSPFGRIFEADNLESALKILEAGHLDFALIDLDLEHQLEGLEFLKEAIDVDCMILSTHDEEEVIKEAFMLGAVEFLNKWDFEKYLKETLMDQLSNHYIDVDQFYRTKNLNLNNKIHEVVKLFQKTREPLLLLGETGVGKGVLAKSLSGDTPFIHVNLSELSSGTIESELFGHIKGSFTGAQKDKEGLLKKADGGILFLDEIGTLSMELQKKLLRVIEEKTFYPVGSEDIETSNFRLICATCDDLKLMVENKEFREDFYYRISSIELLITPLRDRIEDLDEYLKMSNKLSPRKLCFSDEACKVLREYSWPGNFRELKAFLKNQRELSKGLVTAKQLKLKKSMTLKSESLFDVRMQMLIREKGLGELINNIEKDALEWAQLQANGKLNESMRLLNISKSLYYRIQKSLIPMSEA